ncbi:glutaredoxin family protein [Halomicroarcula sp. GCM10025709]|uniref:glutaredoxin family protein n=1 Tax=Haloarcula TaxID=2237 RepID=UPI0024C3164C|nr:glutaredoxin family protein [Halomicroarcula sp. YJ-61-S]
MSATAITVYTRENCDLCEEAIDTIERVAAETETAVDLELVDVDEDPELQDEYGEKVPHVLVDGSPAFTYVVREDDLRERLA